MSLPSSPAVTSGLHHGRPERTRAEVDYKLLTVAGQRRIHTGFPILSAQTGGRLAAPPAEHL